MLFEGLEVDNQYMVVLEELKFSFRVCIWQINLQECFSSNDAQLDLPWNC